MQITKQQLAPTYALAGLTEQEVQALKVILKVIKWDDSVFGAIAKTAYQKLTDAAVRDMDRADLQWDGSCVTIVEVTPIAPAPSNPTAPAQTTTSPTTPTVFPTPLK